MAVCKAVLELVKVLEIMPKAPDVPREGAVAANEVIGKKKLNKGNAPDTIRIKLL